VVPQIQLPMREEGALVSLTQGPFLRAVRHPLAEASGQADMGEAPCPHTVENSY
jgi:hypothetical protein